MLIEIYVLLEFWYLMVNREHLWEQPSFCQNQFGYQVKHNMGLNRANWLL